MNLGTLIIIGIALILGGIFLICKGVKNTRNLKKSLILTGSGMAGLPVFSVLHNFVYGLGIFFYGPDCWGPGGDEPVFLILSVIACPIAMLVGAIWSLTEIRKRKRRKSGD